MDRKCFEFDHSLTDEQNMHYLIRSEIEELFSFVPKTSSPFVYLMAIKNLVITGKIVVLMRVMNGASKLDKLTGCRQLDVALACDPGLHQSFISINGFLEKIFRAFEKNDLILNFKESK